MAVSTRMPRALAVGALLTAMVPATGAAARAPRTHAQIFHAFTAAGAPAHRVSRAVRGSCWEGSLAANRNDAWRCMSGNFIYDPCFSSARAHGIVLCTNDPAGSMIRIRLAKGLPRRSGNRRAPSTSGLPWSLALTSGARCTLSTGATAAIGQRRANYACTRTRDWLWGAPLRSSEPWRIFIAPISASKLRRKVAIRAAWF